MLGDPIGHSLSPVLHRAAYDSLGLDWRYDAVQVPAGSLAAFVATLDSSWRGLSLTMPLKREVLPLLASCDDIVVSTGVCNTVVLESDGSMHGANTDVTGAEAVLAQLDPAATRALVLGGGATALSVVFALLGRGLTHVTMAVRNPETATETVDLLTQDPRPLSVEVGTLADLILQPRPSADVLVSTIPVQAQTLELVETTREIPVVFDVIYDPWPTPLAQACVDSGRRLHSGLDLLVAQAVDQVALMTGHRDVPGATMRRAAEAVLQARA